MADNSAIIKIGIFGAAAYVAYTQGWLSFLGLTPAATPATTGTTTGSTSGSTAGSTSGSSTGTGTTGANSLDTIYQAMLKAAGSVPSEGLGMDAWGYYLNQQLAPLGKTAPDPMPIFQSSVNAANAAQLAVNPNAQVAQFDRSTPMTAAFYWSGMAPALRSQLGLSGLGIYGGLGAVMRRYR